MGAESFTVLAILEARDRASGMIAKVSESLGRFSGTAREAGESAAAAGEQIDSAFGKAAPEAAAGLDEEAAAADRAAVSLGIYHDATGRARLANGQFASSAQGAAAGADKVAAAQERAGTAATESGAAQEAAAAKSATASEESAGAMAGMAEKTKLALLGVAGGLAYGVYKAAGFQQSMELLHTQAGVTTRVMNQMGAGVLRLAGQVGQGPDSLAEAAYHVASNMSSMGATSTQMLSAVKIAAEGASVGNANLVDVTNALGAAIASGMKGTQDYTQAMGAMNATVGAGDMKMQDLAEAFGEGNLATVKGYGATLTDVGAILATFGDNNLRGAAAGTEMRMAVQALAEQASTARPALSQLGLSAGQIGANMRQHGVVDTLNMLNDRMKAAGLTAQTEGPVITELFGKKAGSGISVLLEQINRVNSKVPELVKGAKNFNAAWAAQQATPAQKLKNLESGSEALAINLGTALLPAVTKVVGALSGLVNWLEQGSAGAKSAAAAIGAVLGLIALKKLEDGAKGAVEGVTNLAKGIKTASGAAQTLIGKLTGLSSAQDKAATAAKKSAAAQEKASAAADTAAGEQEAASGEAAAAETDAAETAAANETAAAESSGSWITAAGQQIAAGAGWVAQSAAKVATVIASNVAGAAMTAGAWIAGAASQVASAAIWVAQGIGKVAVMVGANVAGAATTAAAWLVANAVMLLGIGLVVAAVIVAVLLIIKYWKDIEKAAAVVWDAMTGAAKTAWKYVSSLVERDVAFIRSVLAWFGHLGSLFRGWWDDATRAVHDEAAKIISYAEGIPKKILHALGDLGTMMFRAGKSAISMLISGLKSIPVIGTMVSIAGDIADHFPHSPAKRGPLSGSGSPDIAGRNISRMLATGMLAARGTVAAASAQVAAAASPGGHAGTVGSPLALSAIGPASGGGSGGVVVNLTINEPHMMSDSDMDKFLNKLGSRLNHSLGQAGVKIRMG